MKVAGARRVAASLALFASSWVCAMPLALGVEDIWAFVGPTRLGAGRDEIQQDVPLDCQAGDGTVKCTPQAGSFERFAGAPVERVEFLFVNHGLARVTVLFDESQFERLEQYLYERLGAGRFHGYLFRGGMGAEFTNRILLWQRPELVAVLEQFAGRIDRSALNYGTTAAMVDLVKAVTAYRPGSRRDL